MKKSSIVGIAVFVVVFVVGISGYYIYNGISSNKYSCIDPNTNAFYSFNTEEEMHEVCDLFDSNDVEDTGYKNIYNDLVETNDSSFNFYPYINSNNTLSIIVTILDCNNSTSIKNKVEKWFKDHSYNINDYTIEYEYPCE